MTNKTSIASAVDTVNRFHAANFQNFSKRFNLDAAVRKGMARYERDQKASELINKTIIWDGREAIK